MASWGGHTLPGTFFIIFGIFYVFKFTISYLKRAKKGRNSVSYCCNGRIPFSGIVVEGVIKVFMISIGILIELFYPGAPMGHLHNDKGDLTHPANWQHATMYFFFGLSGVADILSFTGRNVLPRGLDRLFGALALFVEGYLFFFHLHGRSVINTRIHILLVLAIWPCALSTFIQCLTMKNRSLLHVFEMLTATLLIVQGTWFWQAAYVLYPPNGQPMDPCMLIPHAESHTHMQIDMNQTDCNASAGLNLMFITLFWTWHIAIDICFVGIIYFVVYKYLKWRCLLDSRFIDEMEKFNGLEVNSATPLHEPLLSEEDEL